MGEKAGGIVGLAIALILVLGIAASPFYFGFLRSSDRALDHAVAPDAELVRRAIANLDHELALLSYIYTEADPEGLNPAALSKYVGDYEDLFAGAGMRDLEKAASVLNSVTQKDRQRGIMIPDRSPAVRGVPNMESIVQHTISQLKSPEQVLRRAEAAMNALRSASAKGLSAANHLDANRVRAIFLLVKARAEMDQAAFEHSQAAVLRAAAEKRSLTLEHLRNREGALALQDPQPLQDNTQERLDRAGAAQAQLQQAIGHLSTVIQAREAELAQLEEAAAYAREELQELDETRLGFEQYRSRYEEFSRAAREAESHAAAIQFGTLRGATVVPEEGPEPTVPQYADGMPDPGLDQLRFRLEQFQAQAATLAEIQEAAAREQAALSELAKRLDEEQKNISRQVQSETSALRELLKKAAAHYDTARKAEDEALKFLNDAAGAGRTAVSAAKKRTGDATAKARVGEKVDERLLRISQDAETEAFLHTVAGQIAYNAALVRFGRIQAADALADAAALGARAGVAVDSPSPADVETLKTEALNDLAEALKSFEQAATLIGRINVRFPDNTTASGKNYVWQAQVGQAACHLLQAALVADDREASFQQQLLAYDLLKEAVEKREQSPLLAPAVDTLIYLQQNVR